MTEHVVRLALSRRTDFSLDVVFPQPEGPKRTVKPDAGSVKSTSKEKSVRRESARRTTCSVIGRHLRDGDSEG